MKKHTDIKHPKKDVKWKTILSGGQKNLFSMFPGKAVAVREINEGSDAVAAEEGDDKSAGGGDEALGYSLEP